MRTRSLLASLAGAALSAVAQAQLVSGSAFQVNGFTTGVQSGAAVANVGPSCNFVVVWSSDGQDGSDTAVVARLFDAFGAPASGDFLVNVTTTGVQGLPSVASNPAGNFVVTWSDGTPGNPGSYEVRARRFDASGTPQGGEIYVNTHTTDQQAGSSVGLDGAGNFVVVWQSAGQDGDGSGVFERRFDANGNPLSGELQVNQYTTGGQTRPRIAMNPGGDFVIAWESPQDAQAGAVMARRYDSAGTPLGDEFRVNTAELDAQHEPDVALDPDGNAIVAWTSYAQDGSDAGVYGQRLDVSGNKLGPEFNVNVFTTGFQGYPRVVAGLGADSGEFAIIFQSDEFGGHYIRTETFHANGRHYGIEMLFYRGFHPAMAAQPNGQFVTAWESYEIEESDGIAARVQGLPRAGVTQVDVLHPLAASVSSNQNGILEVGEVVNVEPSFRNFTTSDMDLLGSAGGFSDFFGDDGGLIYGVPDPGADFGTLGAGGGAADCHQATGDCYQFSLTGTRPVGHVDTQYGEAFTINSSYVDAARYAILHVGGTFADVPSTSIFYPFVETLVHNNVTGGCAGGVNYCPLNNVTRGQMAAFLLRSRWGSTFRPPPPTGTAFPDVPASHLFARWIEELVREGVTAGCGGGLYCPDSPVTRQQMAVFLLKMLLGSTYVPPPCDGNFDDVPCPSQFADWIEDLAGRGVTGGCQANPPQFCPANSVLRQQMAAFIVKTFGLQLY